MLEHYLGIARPWLEQYGYFALFTGVFVEGFGLPAPGQSLVLASAWLADRGDMALSRVLITAWLAAVLGDNLGYLIGRWGGRRVLSKVGVNARHLQRVDFFFSHYGGGIVMVARFFEILRQLNGVIAGSLGMPWWRFLIFNLIGAGLWVGFWGIGIFLLGDQFEKAIALLQAVTPHFIILGLLALTGVVVYLLQRRKVLPRLKLPGEDES